MPVFFNRKSKRSADVGDIVEVQERLEELQSALKRYGRFHISDLRDCLEDLDMQLMLDPNEEELEQVKDKVELIEEKLEDIEALYDIEDPDDYDSIADEFEDLLEDLEDMDFDV